MSRSYVSDTCKVGEIIDLSGLHRGIREIEGEVSRGGEGSDLAKTMHQLVIHSYGEWVVGLQPVNGLDYGVYLRTNGAFNQAILEEAYLEEGEDYQGQPDFYTVRTRQVAERAVALLEAMVRVDLLYTAPMSFVNDPLTHYISRVPEGVTRLTVGRLTDSSLYRCSLSDTGPLPHGHLDDRLFRLVFGTGWEQQLVGTTRYNAFLAAANIVDYVYSATPRGGGQWSISVDRSTITVSYPPATRLEVSWGDPTWARVGTGQITLTLPSSSLALAVFKAVRAIDTLQMVYSGILGIVPVNPYYSYMPR